MRVESECIMSWLATMFQSKKFTATIATVILFLFNDKLGLNMTPETAEKIVWVVGSFVLGQGLADGLSGGKTSGTGNGK